MSGDTNRLGLDLKGGMNVILEISVPDVVDVLADHKTDPAYVKSLQQAKKEEETSQRDFISLFIALTTRTRRATAWPRSSPPSSSRAR